MSKLIAEPKPKNTAAKKPKKNTTANNNNIEAGSSSRAKKGIKNEGVAKTKGTKKAAKKNVFDVLQEHNPALLSEQFAVQKIIASYEPFASNNLTPEAQTSAASEGKAKKKKAKKRSSSKNKVVSASDNVAAVASKKKANK